MNAIETRLRAFKVYTACRMIDLDQLIKLTVLVHLIYYFFVVELYHVRQHGDHTLSIEF